MIPTKAALEAVVADKWSDETAPTRIPVDDRDVAAKVVENLYPDTITDDSDSEIYGIAEDSALYPYYMVLKKIGGMINAQGWVECTSSFASSNNPFFVFRELIDGQPNPFLPDDAEDPATSAPFVFRGEAVRSQDEDRIRVIVLRDNVAGNSKFRLSGNMAGSSGSLSENFKYRFNFWYNAKY